MHLLPLLSLSALLQFAMMVSGRQSYCYPEGWGGDTNFALDQVPGFCWGLALKDIEPGKSESNCFDVLAHS